MRSAKQEIIDAISQMPDNLDRYELLDRLCIEARVEQSLDDFEQNGGYTSEEVLQATRDKYKELLEGRA